MAQLSGQASTCVLLQAAYCWGLLAGHTISASPGQLPLMLTWTSHLLNWAASIVPCLVAVKNECEVAVCHLTRWAAIVFSVQELMVTLCGLAARQAQDALDC